RSRCRGRLGRGCACPPPRDRRAGAARAGAPRRGGDRSPGSWSRYRWTWDLVPFRSTVTAEAAGGGRYTKDFHADVGGAFAEGLRGALIGQKRHPDVSPPGAGGLGGAAELPRQRPGGRERGGHDRQIRIAAEGPERG